MTVVAFWVVKHTVECKTFFIIFLLLQGSKCVNRHVKIDIVHSLQNSHPICIPMPSLFPQREGNTNKPMKPMIFKGRSSVCSQVFVSSKSCCLFGSWLSPSTTHSSRRKEGGSSEASCQAKRRSSEGCVQSASHVKSTCILFPPSERCDTPPPPPYESTDPLDLDSDNGLPSKQVHGIFYFFFHRHPPGRTRIVSTPIPRTLVLPF